MGTHVRLKRSGGVAGMSLVASVDVDELPPADAKKLRAALASVDFDAPPVPPARRGGADTFQYDLVVTDDGTRSLTAHDPFVGRDVRAVLDVLLPLARPE